LSMNDAIKRLLPPLQQTALLIGEDLQRTELT
jgi:hypothetical protein